MLEDIQIWNLWWVKNQAPIDKMFLNYDHILSDSLELHQEASLRI